jgi:hypothetical protein
MVENELISRDFNLRHGTTLSTTLRQNSTSHGREKQRVNCGKEYYSSCKRRSRIRIQRVAAVASEM